MSPAAARTPKTTDALAETSVFWETRTGQPLSPEEAHQCIRAMSGFFDLLVAWEGQVASQQHSEGAEGNVENS